jgi:hypothetical protein
MTLWVAGASAAPVLYTNEAAFRADAAAAGIGLSVEVFDGRLVQQTVHGNYSTLDFGAFTASIDAIGGQPRSFATNLDIDPMEWAAAPTDLGLDWESNGESPTVIAFDSPVNAVLLEIVDFGTVGNVINDLLVAVDGGPPQLALQTSGNAPRGNARFVGVIDGVNAFSNLSVLSTAVSDFVEIDNLEYGSNRADTGAQIPVPATLGLLAGGLAALAVMRRGGRAGRGRQHGRPV